MNDLIIVGAGPAGLTAAIYAARAGLSVQLIESMMPGGQAANTDLIENYPGFPDGVGGFELMQLFYKQAERWGMDYKTATVTGLAEEGSAKLVRCGEETLRARAVLIAGGARPRHLNISGEEELAGCGVSYCGTCDGPLFRGRTVVAVGGGNTAFQEALFLSRFATRVYLVHRRREFRAQQVLIERAQNDEKIEFITNSEPVAIEGADKVERIKLLHRDDGSFSELACDGVFIFVGHQANTDFCAGFLPLADDGFLPVDENLMTARPGFFAAGDVLQKDFRQVATAVGEGATAVHRIEQYLSAH